MRGIVDDLVLVEKVDEETIVETLQKRYENERIYVSIASVITIKLTTPLDIYWPCANFIKSLQTTQYLF